MAISQDKYVKIISKDVGSPSGTQRRFGALVFTKATKTVDGVEKSSWKGEGDFTQPVSVGNSTQALDYFSTDSDEYDFATRYFSWAGPSGRTGNTLTFVKMAAGQTPVEALVAIDGAMNNFGSFCYLDSGYTCKQFQEVGNKIKEWNYRYLFSVVTTAEYRKTTDASVVVKEAANDNVVEDCDAKSLSEYFNANCGEGICVEKGTDMGSAFKPMVMFDSVNYDGVDTTLNFCFKQFPGEEATVTDDKTKDALDGANVNYIGMTQQNGTMRSFYQCGVNTDGQSTSVYCNEIWLKSRIATDILSLMLSVNRIPANEDGELLVGNVISTAAEKGITNGVIEKNKTLTDEQKRTVFTITKDEEAWRVIEQSGYYLTTEIKQEDSGKYSLYYRLVYSKDDAITYVEGEHYLV